MIEVITVAGWSSLVARRAHNPKVIGSNPIPATNFLRFFFMHNHNLKHKRIFLSNLSVKKVLVTLACFLIIFVALSGCERVDDLKGDILNRFAGEKELDSAVETVEVFFNHIINHEFEQAYNYIYKEKESSKVLEDFISEFADVTQIVSFETNWVEVKNNIAIVGLDLIDTYDNEEKIYKDLQISLIKDDNGEWKINFWQ